VTLTKEEFKARIDSILLQYQAAGQSPAQSVVPASLVAGKLYEAWVLCEVLERLAADEGYKAVLVSGSSLVLRSSPGPIDRGRFPHFDLTRNRRRSIEIWTDVEFVSLSFSRSGSSAPTLGDYHELDIVVVPAGINGRPAHGDVLLGVECKDTGYVKSLLREILGVRRELSLLADDSATEFQRWPRATVPARPASCLLVYSTDPKVSLYSRPGKTFGIDFHHLPPP
jgi:hypothetical protein